MVDRPRDCQYGQIYIRVYYIYLSSDSARPHPRPVPCTPVDSLFIDWSRSLYIHCVTKTSLFAVIYNFILPAPILIQSENSRQAYTVNRLRQMQHRYRGKSGLGAFTPPPVAGIRVKTPGDYIRPWNGDAENAGLEYAGLENAAPNCRGGKCGTKKVWKANQHACC